jgi:ribosome-binding factor A|tara:strand:- start:10 stop:348 length:339 start_codon:yes stop_codon:yes gene_type:complete
MSSIRQEKVGSLVKQELSILFQREAAMHFGGLFITVTRIRMSPDLGLAKVYLSFMAVKDTEVALTVVKKESNWTRHALAGVIGKQVRRIPELQFYIDDSLDYYDAVEKALKS